MDFAASSIGQNFRICGAVSLEFAEHIPEENVDTFMDSLVALSDIILFSAAIPHQRGRGHINEQYQSYWVNKLRQRGYEYFDAIRKDVWNDVKNYSFFNTDEQKCLDAKVFSSYKGTPRAKT